MALVNTDMFTDKDLKLFIESVEEITRLEIFRKQCRQRHRALYFIKTLRYLDQTFPIGSSCTLPSIDRPEEMQELEILEEKPLKLHPLQNKCDKLKRHSSFELKLKGAVEVKDVTKSAQRK